MVVITLSYKVSSHTKAQHRQASKMRNSCGAQFSSRWVRVCSVNLNTVMLTGSSTWSRRHLCSCFFSILTDKLCDPKICGAFYCKIYSGDKTYIISNLFGLLLLFKAYSLKRATCSCGVCHMFEACTETSSHFLTSTENVLLTLSRHLFMLLNSRLIQELCGCVYNRYTSYWGELECWHKL